MIWFALMVSACSGNCSRDDWAPVRFYETQAACQRVASQVRSGPLFARCEAVRTPVR